MEERIPTKWDAYATSTSHSHNSHKGKSHSNNYVITHSLRTGPNHNSSHVITRNLSSLRDRSHKGSNPPNSSRSARNHKGNSLHRSKGRHNRAIRRNAREAADKIKL